MRSRYLVTYDIGDPKRGALIYRLMRGYGDHLQLSVFLCELSRQERIELQARLEPLINHRQDQILFANLGPTDGRSQTAIEALGRRYDLPETLAIIV